MVYMKRQDLISAYKIAVNRLSLESSDVTARLFNDFINTEHPTKHDDAQIALFTRCYDLTMTYLKAKQDIKTQYDSGNMTHDERQQLMQQAIRIKDMGRDSFNVLCNHDIYTDNAVVRPYFAFWEAFYHREDIDMQMLTNAFKEHLNQSRDVFEIRDNEKMSSKELGDACLKFTSASEFVKMARLALSVENKNIHKLGDYINGLDRLTKDVAEKHAMESRLTDKGFVTHYAFALNEEKRVREKTVNAVERYMLSTPDITNKIAQEYVHVGALGNKIAVLPQQITYGANKNVEILIDSVRGVCEAEKGAGAIKGSMSKVLGFLTRDKADPKMQKDIESWSKAFEKRAKNIMPQESLGRHQRATVRDMAIDLLLIDAKIENKVATEKDLNDKTLLKKTVEAFKKTVKSAVEDVVYGDVSAMSVAEKLLENIKDGSIEALDSVRYDNLSSFSNCDGEHSMANLRLLTHMISQGEMESKINPAEYEEAMSFLDGIFADDVFQNRDWIESQSNEDLDIENLGLEI